MAPTLEVADASVLVELLAEHGVVDRELADGLLLDPACRGGSLFGGWPRAGEIADVLPVYGRRVAWTTCAVGRMLRP